jgi:hypothetical protein
MGVLTRVGRGPPEIANRGYNVLFRQNESNHCPGCGRAQWYVGRITAECVFCGTALPLAEARWAESGAPSAHLSLPAGTRGAERRRHQRREGVGRTVHLLVDGSKRAVAVHNLSIGGVSVALSSEILAASTVEAIAASGEIVRAELRWKDAEAAGFQFAKPVRLELGTEGTAE